MRGSWITHAPSIIPSAPNAFGDYLALTAMDAAGVGSCGRAIRIYRPAFVGALRQYRLVNDRIARSDQHSVLRGDGAPNSLVAIEPLPNDLVYDAVHHSWRVLHRGGVRIVGPHVAPWFVARRRSRRGSWWRIGCCLLRRGLSDYRSADQLVDETPERLCVFRCGSDSGRSCAWKRADHRRHPKHDARGDETRYRCARSASERRRRRCKTKCRCSSPARSHVLAGALCARADLLPGRQIRPRAEGLQRSAAERSECCGGFTVALQHQCSPWEIRRSAEGI